MLVLALHIVAVIDANSYHSCMQDDQAETRGWDPKAGTSDSRQPVSRTTSRALLGNARELIIEHDGREYRLRLTQQGKLILTA